MTTPNRKTYLAEEELEAAIWADVIPVDHARTARIAMRRYRNNQRWRRRLRMARKRRRGWA